MNADKFFEKYSLEEISKKTKISPISLRFIKNREFEKIPRAKFFGFINIIEKNFNVDLSELKEEYNQFVPKKENEEITHIPEKKKDFSGKFLIIASAILVVIGAYMLFNSFQKHQTSEINTSQEIKIPPQTENNTENINETNLEQNNTNQTQNEVEKTNQIKIINNTVETNNTVKNETNITKPLKSSVDIIPHEKVWFRALNIDTNKTIEYLTSKEKILPKGNYYIKFGHGNITINYANQTIEPNTKKIIRILLKNGKYKFMTKPNRYEK